MLSRPLVKEASSLGCLHAEFLSVFPWLPGVITFLSFLALPSKISDLIRQSTKESPLWEFLSLGYALMLCPFVIVLGGMFFLATALFFLSDRAKAEQQWVVLQPATGEGASYCFIPVMLVLLYHAFSPFQVKDVSCSCKSHWAYSAAKGAQTRLHWLCILCKCLLHGVSAGGCIVLGGTVSIEIAGFPSLLMWMCPMGTAGLATWD